MTKNRKMEYDAPMVEQLQARVEKGFAGSSTPEPQGLQGTGMESYGKGMGNTETGGYVFS